METFMKIWPILIWLFVAVIIIPCETIKDSEKADKFLIIQIILVIIQVICLNNSIIQKVLIHE